MRYFHVKKSVIVISIGLILYCFILELYYYFFVGVSYDKFLFELNLNIFKYIESKIYLILVLAFSFFLSRRSEFIYSVFTFFVIFFLIPNMVTYAFEDQMPWPLYSILLLQILLGTVSVNTIHVSVPKSIKLSTGVVVFLVMLIMLPFFVRFGLYFNLNNLLLEDIGTTRSFFDENASTIINYIYNWLAKAIIPMLFVYFLIRKQKIYALLVLGVLLYLYLISGNKIVFITAFIVLLFYFVGQDYLSKTLYFMLCFLFLLALIPIFDHLLESHKLKGLFIMRTLLLPAHLNYLYFDYFLDNPLFYAESNFFKWFVTNPLSKPVGFVISEKYFSASDMNSNNGIISDGYMNLGYLGVLLNIILVTVIFLYFNSLKIDSRYLGIFFVIVFLFLSVPMLSMIVTNGLWLVVLLAPYLMQLTSNTDKQTANKVL